MEGRPKAKPSDSGILVRAGEEKKGEKRFGAIEVLNGGEVDQILQFLEAGIAVKLSFVHFGDVFPDGFGGAEEEEAAGAKVIDEVADDAGAGDFVEVDEDVAAKDEIEGGKVRRDEAEIEGLEMNGGQEIVTDGGAAGKG